MLLKPNMIVPGNKSGEKLNIKEIAEKTLTCLTKTVPELYLELFFYLGD